jgi:hypothetical protein
MSWKGRTHCAIFILHLLGEAKVEWFNLICSYCLCHPRRCFLFLSTNLITDKGACGNIKKVMKNSSRRKLKTKETLPLERLCRNYRMGG